MDERFPCICMAIGMAEQRRVEGSEKVGSLLEAVMAIPLAQSSLAGLWATTPWVGVRGRSCHGRIKITKVGLLRTEDACRYKDW